MSEGISEASAAKKRKLGQRFRPEYCIEFSCRMKSTLTPQGLPKYIYLSPPLIFPTTYNRIRTKKRPVWITPGAAPICWMGPIRNPRWEQKRTEGYVIVSSNVEALIQQNNSILDRIYIFCILSSMFMLTLTLTHDLTLIDAMMEIQTEKFFGRLI
jgi:hypothetical protein